MRRVPSLISAFCDYYNAVHQSALFYFTSATELNLEQTTAIIYFTAEHFRRDICYEKNRMMEQRRCEKHDDILAVLTPSITKSMIDKRFIHHSDKQLGRTQ